MSNKLPVGFIGQGFIGKHMADDFEQRGYNIVRYALEEPYVKNKAKIVDCDITFVAVPTPTTPDGFDASLIKSVLPLIGKGKTVVIKSTILPGTTEELQEAFPDILVMHSPEFLREKSAAEDTSHPERTIVGIPVDSKKHRRAAERVLGILPDSPHSIITTARNAECIKYIGNAFLYTKLTFMNIAHDFAQSAKADWQVVREMVGNDSRIGHGHTQVVHDSGRGAGGHCFIKDFEALLQYYEEHVLDDLAGSKVLRGLRAKNHQLLLATEKDLGLLNDVYGESIPLD